MRKITLTGLAVIASISLSFGQLQIVAPSSNVNLGDVSKLTPEEIDDPKNKLNVGYNMNVLGNLMRVGYKVAGQASKVQIGLGRTAGGNAIIECYGLPNGAAPTSKLLSNKNGVSTFTHNGPGQFQLKTTHANADIFLMTRSATRMIILENGNVGINEMAPSYQFQVNGAAAKPGGGSWTGASDKRLKENIKQYDLGLEDVLKLNPIYYNYNGKGGIDDTETTYVGLIAQEYQKVAPDAVSTFTHTEMIPQEEDQVYKTGVTEDYLAIDPSQITFMLVNSIKEQQQQIGEQQHTIEEQHQTIEIQSDAIAKLQVQLTELSEAVTNLQSVSNPISSTIQGSGKAWLGQNTPNPLKDYTRIDYFIPKETDKAFLTVQNVTGQTIKRIDITEKGKGFIELKLNDMAMGMYSYRLKIDGNTVDTKKMIVE